MKISKIQPFDMSQKGAKHTGGGPSNREKLTSKKVQNIWVGDQEIGRYLSSKDENMLGSNRVYLIFETQFLS